MFTGRVVVVKKVTIDNTTATIKVPDGIGSATKLSMATISKFNYLFNLLECVFM